MDAFQQEMEENRACFSRVRSLEQDDFSVLDFAVGVGSPTHPKHSRQTGDARSVSRTVATIDVIAADHHASELLSDEVHFVGGLRATEHPERVRAISVDGLAQTLSGAIERLVPTGRTACPRHERAALSASLIAGPLSLPAWFALRALESLEKMRLRIF
jgi:hypothetical protein